MKYYGHRALVEITGSCIKKSVCASRNFLQSGKSFSHCRAMMSQSWAFVQEVPKDFQNLKMLMNFGRNTRIWPFLAKFQTKMKQKEL